MNNPKISIIIPVYGVEKYIGECLESVVNQTLKDIEIIIVNDGTRDNSMKIVEKYLKDKRIKVINKENGGLSSARNAGIKEAKGSYILHVDSDDFIDLEMSELMYKKAIEKDADVVIVDIKLFGNTIKEKWQDSTFLENKIYTGKEYLEEYFLGKGCPAVCNKLWKRELYIKNRVYHPENISYGEDGATTPRLLINADKIIKINRSLYHYRKRAEAMTSKKIVPLDQYIVAYDICCNYIEKIEKKWFEKYKFTFKLNYVYSNLLFFNIFSEKIQSNKNYKKIYNEFLKEIQKEKICFSKNLKIISLQNIQNLMYKIYSKSIILGEVYKLFYNLSRKILKSMRKKC